MIDISVNCSVNEWECHQMIIAQLEDDDDELSQIFSLFAIYNMSVDCNIEFLSIRKTDCRR
ncbi:hypothetical protein D3C78_1679040 [compost metagenome]